MTDLFPWCILTVAVGMVLLAAIHILAGLPNEGLAEKVHQLSRGCSLMGRTYQEITAACDAPTETILNGDGRKICCWKSPGFQIRLIFDSHNVCLGEAEDE